MDVYEHLVENGEFGSTEELESHLKKIVRGCLAY